MRFVLVQIPTSIPQVRDKSYHPYLAPIGNTRRHRYSFVVVVVSGVVAILPPPAAAVVGVVGALFSVAISLNILALDAVESVLLVVVVVVVVHTHVAVASILLRRVSVECIDFVAPHTGPLHGSQDDDRSLGAKDSNIR